MDQESFPVPILLLVFNRPDLTTRVFQAIRQVRPRTLYVSADAPRTNSDSDLVLCAEVRQIVTNIDWPCNLHTQFFSSNQGCRDGEALGMEWFFSEQPEGIILEDDTLPLSSFFSYCQCLLERYRDSRRIFSISGNSFLPAPSCGRASYFFSSYADYWGWAGWRRSWESYDRHIKEFPSWHQGDGLAKVFPSRADARNYWYSILEQTFRGHIDTWDYQMLFNMWMHNGCSIMPTVNLVRNLGFRADGTHTTRPQQPSWLRRAVFADLESPLRHPDSIEVNALFDDSFFDHVFAPSQNPKSISSRLRRLANYFS